MMMVAMLMRMKMTRILALAAAPLLTVCRLKPLQLDSEVTSSES